ncbi:Scr1 family TA system antitoxin-like transcriptional regulator [Streptomyces sp. NPDC048155]|uniref:Scr1 family TA system antitoxin-like transcriptional regulator n=1 Tax=Streptomyces sp. NPDC048155 TaxID=3154818 RepID=UPI0033CEF412
MSLVIRLPVLLQTVDHARAPFREVAPPLLPYEVEHGLSHRIKRQGVLHGDRPVHGAHPRGCVAHGVRRA